MPKAEQPSKLKSFPWATTAAALSVIGALFGAWMFIDGYFAKVNELKLIQQQAQITKWTFEESQNTLRMDILEDRIWRERKQTPIDKLQIEKWNDQIKSLEHRQVTIKENKEQIIVHNITSNSGN